MTRVGTGARGKTPLFQGAEGTPLSTGKATPLSPLVRGVKAISPDDEVEEKPP